MLGSKQAPAFIGAIYRDTLQGIACYKPAKDDADRRGKTVCYPGAVTWLQNMNDPIRTAYCNEFNQQMPREYCRDSTRIAFKDRMKDLASSSRPRLLTTEEALESAQRVMNRESKQEDEPYKFVDAYTKLMPGWDKIRRVLNDYAHALGNLDKVCFIRNVSYHDRFCIMK